jgi:hypothetical protein
VRQWNGRSSHLFKVRQRVAAERREGRVPIDPVTSIFERAGQGRCRSGALGLLLIWSWWEFGMDRALGKLSLTVWGKSRGLREPYSLNSGPGQRRGPRRSPPPRRTTKFSESRSSSSCFRRASHSARGKSPLFAGPVVLDPRREPTCKTASSIWKLLGANSRSIRPASTSTQSATNDREERRGVELPRQGDRHDRLRGEPSSRGKIPAQVESLPRRSITAASSAISRINAVGLLRSDAIHGTHQKRSRSWPGLRTSGGTVRGLTWTC